MPLDPQISLGVQQTNEKQANKQKTNKQTNKEQTDKPTNKQTNNILNTHSPLVRRDASTLFTIQHGTSILHLLHPATHIRPVHRAVEAV